MPTRTLLRLSGGALCCLSLVLYVSADPYLQADAELAVKYAGAAYCCGTLGQGVERWDCYACKMLPHMNATVFSDRATNTNGFLGYEPATDKIWVSFAGTDPTSLKHWIDDADFAPAKYNASECPGCKVHGGFYKCWRAVQKEVTRQVDLLQQVHKTASLVVTGHSLGAGIATLAALGLKNTHWTDRSGPIPLTALHTFGQPRVGNTPFASYVRMQLRLWRLTHYRDPVPHLAPLGLLDYRHTSTEVFYNEANTHYQVCDGSGEDPKCSDQILDVLLTDHWHYANFSFLTGYLSCKL